MFLHIFFMISFCDLYVIFKTNCLGNFEVSVLSNKEPIL